MRSEPSTAGRPSRWRPVALAVSLALVLVSGLAAEPTRAIGAVTPPSQTVNVDALDRASSLFVARGSATVAAVVDTAAGRSALEISDVAAADRLELTPATGPTEIQGLPKILLLDVKGDSGWRPVYLMVRDATGEIFQYWIGRIASPDWQTVSVNLTAKPTTTTWGDQDGVLDLPVSFFRIVMDPLPDGASATVDVAIDNLRMVVEPWTRLAMIPKTFAPSTGATGVVSMTLQREGPFVATLRDEMGRVRTWHGTSTAGATARLTWNGRDDAGALMAGSIRGRVTLGTGTGQTIVDIPYLGGLLAQAAVDPKSIVGMNTFFSEPNPAQRSFVEWQARRLEEARVSQIRETFIWDRVEPRKGWFEWAKFDQAVEIAEAHGMGVLGVLAFTADWATSAPSTVTGQRRTLYAPADLADFGNYVTAVVRRYRDRVDEWEIWNEPNHPKFWFPKPDANAYAPLLHLASQIIRREDPGSTVVLGGIVGTDITFLNKLRAAGVWNDFDVLAIHGYVRLSPEASGLGGWFDRAMAYVEKYGVKPVWLTEICYPVSAAEPGIPAVTASDQVAYLSRTYVRAAEAGVARLFWYNVIDHPSGIGSRYDACGLFDANRQPRATFAAFKTVGAAFDGSVTMGQFDPTANARKPVNTSSARWTTNAFRSGNRVFRDIAGLNATYHVGSVLGSIQFSTWVGLPGRPTSLSASVTGDGTGNSVLMAFEDAGGERCSATLAPLRSGTRQIRLPLDGSAANWNCLGGNRNGRLDAPVTLRAITIYPTGIGPLAGSLRVFNLQVGEGPVDRGLVLAHGRTIRLLVSRSVAAAGAVTSISLPGGATATELSNGARLPLTVTGGVLRLGVSPRTRAVEISLAMTSGSIAPPSLTWFPWIAGEGTRATAQIVRADGTWVKTDINRTYRAGLQSVVWDGYITTNGVRVKAPAGKYTVRMVITSPDRRTGLISAPVTVR